MKTAAELADAILNWQNVQRGEVEEVEPWAQPTLAGLIQRHHNAVVEECAALVDRRARIVLSQESKLLRDVAGELRLLKGCT